MQEQNLIETLLLRLDSEKENWQVVSAREIKTWPSGMLAFLIDEGLLTETVPSSNYTCTSCDDEHDEEVIILESQPGSTSRLYIECPSVGRISVNSEDLRQWRIVPEGLAKLVGKLINIPESYSEIVPGRAWRLGIVNLGGATREIFLLRGLNWIDGASLRKRVLKSVNPNALVLLTPYFLPEDNPRVIPLTRILHLGNRSITLDLALLDLIIIGWKHVPDTPPSNVKLPLRQWATTTTLISIKKIIWQRYVVGEDATQIQRFLQLHSGEKKYQNAPASIKTIRKDIQDFYKMPSALRSKVIEEIPELKVLIDKK